MFIAALFIKTKKLQKPKCPSVDGLTHKMCLICTVDCYSTMKRKKNIDETYSNMDEP